MITTLLNYEPVFWLVVILIIAAIFYVAGKMEE